MIFDLQATGDASAKFELAVKHRTGDGVPLNLAEAVIWYAQAALGGHAVALSTLRLAARDEVEGAQRHLEAVEGDGIAKFALAVAFKYGRGVRQSDAEADRWCRLAAEQGHPLDQYYHFAAALTPALLAEVHDDPEAVGLFRSMAEQAGAAEAQVALGDAYRQGQGVPQDDAEAFRWYQLAAEQDHFGAQVELARSYLEGFGVSQDYELAHIWANRAVGHAPRHSRQAAIKLREQAEAHFSSSEIRALQKQAREWPPTADHAKDSSSMDSVTPDTKRDLQSPVGVDGGAVNPELPTIAVNHHIPGMEVKFRPGRKAKFRRMMLVTLVLAAFMWIFRHEYESATFEFGQISFDYQIRRNRWTDETCNIYPERMLGQLPQILGQGC